MTEIIFVRHGATAWTGHRYCGRSDPPLDATGLAAAASLAASLAPTVPPHVWIVTSPARRALQTAAAIAAAVGRDDADVLVDDRWVEADCGIAEGRTFDELAALAPDLAAALARGEPAIDWPGGETAEALAARVEAAWDDVISRGVPTVVVSHAGPLRLALGLALARPPETAEWLEPATAARVEIVRRRAVSETVLRSLT